MSPRKRPEEGQRGKMQQGSKNKSTRSAGADTGDGSAVFAQLEKYLRADATPAFVFDTVRRLATLAKERRFKDHVQRRGAEAARLGDQAKMRDEWCDEAPAETQEEYQGLRSYWDGDSGDHMLRLQKLMAQWVLDFHFSQEEIETRLQFVTFEAEVAGQEQEEEEKEPPRSYIGAVVKGLAPEPAEGHKSEQQLLYDLCVHPMQELTKLRPRTEQEDRALLMILNHELEVPHPPHFLVQSMTARELACFTDVFLAIEYPIYAHLAAGHRYGEILPKAVLLAQIYVGPEAATAQKRDRADCKAAVSCVSLDTETRVLTATFMGKQTAARWINWKFPFAGKLLTMVDYEGQREDAEATHALINIDYYSFTVAVRKGTVTSSDMYWVLTSAMGLHVQSLKHTRSGSEGMDDTQWMVRIKGGACKSKLRAIGFMAVDDTEIVVHHDGSHVNWPCKTCYSPDHPTKYCRTDTASLDSTRKLHKKELKGKLPSNRGKGGRCYKPGRQPKTLDQLRQILRGGHGGEDTTHEMRASVSDNATSALADATGDHQAKWQTGDPKEWKQHSPTRMGSERGNRAQQDTERAEPAAEAKGTEADLTNSGESVDEGSAERGARDGEGDVVMEEDKETAEEGDQSDGQKAQGMKATPSEQQDESRGRQLREAPTPSKDVGSRRLMKVRPSAEGETSPMRGTRPLPETKRDSISPKRSLPVEWEHDGEGRTPADASQEPTKACGEGRVRSLSPIKRRKENNRHKKKTAQQSLMHQFLTAEVVKTENPSPESCRRATPDKDDDMKEHIDKES